MIKVLCPTATVMLTSTEMYSKPCSISIAPENATKYLF